MVSPKAKLPMDAVDDICRRFDVVRLEMFGSATRDDFHDGSDLDFLVLFRNNDYGPWMCKLTELQEALAAVIGRDVDVVSRRGVEQSANRARRESILNSAQVVYEA